MINETAIRVRYEAIKDRLDERGRRLFVAAEKIAAGYGGTAAVSRATGVAHSTIIRGAKDLLTVPAVTERVRRKGAGRPALSQSNPAVLEDLRRLVEPATTGDSMRPLRRTHSASAHSAKAAGHPSRTRTSGTPARGFLHAVTTDSDTSLVSRHPRFRQLPARIDRPARAAAMSRQPATTRKR
jgi:hypothetical protein